MKLLMSKQWKVYGLITGLLILTLFILACGDAEETPIPTPTPIDIAGITSEFQKVVQQEVEKIQPPLSEAEIRNLIETAISTGVPESVSAAEIQAMVNNAVAATAAEAVTGAEVTEAIGKAIVEAAATAPEPLTKSDIEGIVKAAIPAPTVAPTPTATTMPTATPMPTTPAPPRVPVQSRLRLAVSPRQLRK